MVNMSKWHIHEFQPYEWDYGRDPDDGWVEPPPMPENPEREYRREWETTVRQRGPRTALERLEGITWFWKRRALRIHGEIRIVLARTPILLSDEP
jgi:hypothetical protein